MQQIVVGVDGSDSAAAALRWALRESAVHRCPLTAVMAWDYLNQHHANGSTSFDPAYDAGAAQAALDRFVIAAVGDCDAEGVAAELVFDLAGRGLVEASKAASLLVVGARGLGGFDELLLGSVSERCLHDATCPVVIVRSAAAEPARPHDRIVVGIDGSANGQAALQWAGQEALARGAVLRVVHAAQPGFAAIPLPDSVRAVDVIHKEATALLERSIARAALPAVTVEVVAATGSPAGSILDACSDADLVVVGRTGRGPLAGRVLGSVARQISHHARLPAVFISAHDRW